MKLVKNKIFFVGIVLVIVLAYILIFIFNRTYTVTFTLKIGAGIETQQVKKGETVKMPATPEATGYEFVGWYLDGAQYDFNTPVEKDLNLEAKWQEK